jgi:hypothetical protein
MHVYERCLRDTAEKGLFFSLFLSDAVSKHNANRRVRLF